LTASLDGGEDFADWFADVPVGTGCPGARVKRDWLLIAAVSSAIVFAIMVLVAVIYLIAR
jgi:hypothetical protein